MLTAQSIAWFQTHNLPRPAAAGVFCASLGQLAAGDSAVLGMAVLGMTPPPRSATVRPAAAAAPTYMGAVANDNPLAYPLTAPAVLAKFPPTLFVSGTRSFEFSAALNSHNQLTKAGVESQFHGWDGMFHGFFYNSEFPESREAYDIMTKFFDTHLAR
jgi:acetyl esterase/lipase